MKLSSFSILASLGLAALQASASPIRIVMISSSSPAPHKVEVNHYRFGPAADASLPDLSSKIVLPLPHQAAVPKPMHKGAGCSASLRASNWLRQKLGLPVIEPHHRLTHVVHHHKPSADGLDDSTAKYTVFTPAVPLERPHHHSHHHDQPAHHHQMQMWHRRPHHFATRLQNALMMLSPWEGRAVAFVIGCGIGSLLRMLYVLFVVGFRSIRGGNSEEEEVDIVFEAVEVMPTPAPPAYPADEKIEMEDEKPLITN